MRHLVISCLSLFSSLLWPLLAQSIEEKKQALSHSGSAEDALGSQMHQMQMIEQELEILYDQAYELSKVQAPPTAFSELAVKAQVLNEKRQQLFQHSRASASSHHEAEAIWHLPDATVKQLVMDFGASDTVFVIPEELGQRKVGVVSNLALPRQLWPSMLELVLSQMGIGVRQINPFCKELFTIGVSEGFDKITDRAEDLWLMPDHSRVCFVLSSEQVDVKQFSRNLMRFVDPASTQIKPIGSHLAVIAPALRVRQILQIYEFMARSQHNKSYRIVNLSRLAPEDLQKMLGVIFSQSPNAEGRSELDPVGVQIFPIHHESRAALFVAGSESEVKRACALIEDLENQIESTSGKKLFWYCARHAHIEDLAKVVAKIYGMLTQTMQAEDNQIVDHSYPPATSVTGNVAPLVVSPNQVGYPHLSGPSTDANLPSQIVVDPKSGALAMVVEPTLMPKLKELIAKLDTPKKMVRVDFLLFEKKISDEMQFGLDLLRTGSAASNTKSKRLSYNLGAHANPSNYGRGILNFFMSRTKVGGAPAFDIAYNFLLAQDSIQINANPSIVTLNGTASSVNLVDEISVSTGPVEWKDQETVRLKDSYTRAQYGITIKVTPTVHQSDDEGDRMITLDTDITFDTTRSNSNDRPNVTRRNIKNLVRIAEGETVILGGLRQKDSADRQDSLPFLGEIPGLGKLFSYTSMVDRTTEMFIFITPHIIDDPREDLQKLQELEMRKRPGEVNEFLAAYQESQQRRKAVIFSRTLQTLFGRMEEAKTPRSTSIKAVGKAYDGRS